MGYPAYKQYKNSDPTRDGFVQPRSIAKLVNKTQLSRVTIYCDYSAKKYGQGSGWSTNLKIKKNKKFPTAIVTNYHVIEDCLDADGNMKPGSIKIIKLYGVKE